MRIFKALGFRTEVVSSAVAWIATGALAAIGSTVLLAGSAAADSITGGSIDQARGCSTVNCAFGTETFQLQAAENLSGTITLDTTALTLEFTFSTLSLTLDQTTAGTEDNGVAAIVFSDVTYSGIVGVFEAVPGTFIVNPGSTASVAGDQIQLDDLGNPVNPTPPDFDAALARLTGNCLVTGGALNCGLTFGTSAFEIGVGDPATTGPAQIRYFQHTADLVAVPEPATLAMLGFALVFTGLAGRRR